MPADKQVQEVDVTLLYRDGQCEFITIYPDDATINDRDFQSRPPSRNEQNLIAYIRQHFFASRSN